LPIIRGITARENMLGGVIAARGFFFCGFSLTVIAVPKIEKQAAALAARACLPCLAKCLRLYHIFLQVEYILCMLPAYSVKAEYVSRCSVVFVLLLHSPAEIAI